MTVTITSFSYKRRLPEDKTGNSGGFVFDCRAMPNPYWDESLRGYTGRDKPICDFFDRTRTRWIASSARRKHSSASRSTNISKTAATTFKSPSAVLEMRPPRSGRVA